MPGNLDEPSVYIHLLLYDISPYAGLIYDNVSVYLHFAPVCLSLCEYVPSHFHVHSACRGH